MLPVCGGLKSVSFLIRLERSCREKHGYENQSSWLPRIQKSLFEVKDFSKIFN
jgi:hypothetical protein